ncbi:MAG TPA: hypothetical protein VKU41_19865 [Polyangiaceae bacterium]|nr:hypothetical protein [Polyangiaceae bacterium]
MRAAVAHVLEISDGKIVRFDQYVDSATINAIMTDRRKRKRNAPG